MGSVACVVVGSVTSHGEASQLYGTQFMVSRSWRTKQWQFEQTATGVPLFYCCCCCFVHFPHPGFVGLFPCFENNRVFLGFFFLSVCHICVCSRGVDLPVVCVFLPPGQSVEPHTGHQRDPSGRSARRRGLLILLNRHLGAWHLTSVQPLPTPFRVVSGWTFSVSRPQRL